MDFYNKFNKIYKIFRKIGFIMFIILVIFSIKKAVFGSYTEDNPFYFYYDGNTYPIYSINDVDCNNFVIVVRNNGGLQYIYSSDPFYIDYNNGASKVIPTNNAYITKVNINNGVYDLVNSTNTTNIVNANGISGQVLYTNFTIYDVNGDVYATTIPIIQNNASSIENWSFDNLEIELGSAQYNSLDFLTVYYGENTYNIYDFYYNANVVYVKKSTLNKYITFVEQQDITFQWNDTDFNNMAGTMYDLGTYTITLSSSIVSELNNTTDRDNQNQMIQQQQQMVSEQQQTNEKLDTLNSTITDSTVDDDAIDLPTVDVGNETLFSSFSNIFTSFYNAFTSGDAQDIVFPFPNTDKSITLQANYLENALNNSGSSWIVNFIHVFWWYYIGGWIATDCYKKVLTIQKGDAEHIQPNSITEDML